MSNPTLDLEVRVGDRSVTHYQHDGKVFVEGRESTEFAIRLKNPHPFRVKAVLSVDGVNVVDGKPAQGTQDETGYILNAHETQTILGFRLDDNTVARFRFAKAGESYAQAEKGLTGTTGVIGCRVFKERVAPEPVIKEIHYHHDHWHNDYPWWWWRPYREYPNPPVWYGSITCGGDTTTTYTASLGTANCVNTYALNAVNSCGDQMRCLSSTEAQQANPFDLGTSWGSKADSAVTRVGFEVDYLIGSVEVYYTTRAGLEALGIDLSRQPKVAFPKAFGSGEYCSPPRGWQG